MLAFRFAERRTFWLVVDLIIVELTTLLAFWIMAVRGDRIFDSAYLFDQMGWFVFLPSLWFFSAFLNDFYGTKKMLDLASAALSLLRSIALVIVIYLFIYFFFGIPGSLPRGIVGYQGAASFILITLWRAVCVFLVRRSVFARKVVIIGAGWSGQTIATAIVQSARADYRILGFVDDDPTKQNQPVEIPGTDVRVPVIGTSRDLARLVKVESVPEVILAISYNLSSQLFQALLDCKEQGAQITLMPELFEQLTGMVPIEHIGDNWNVALPLGSAGASGFYSIAKRLFDIFGALVGLVFYIPLLPFLIIAIKLDSPGSAFYTQERVGQGGKIIKLPKLRTMIENAEPDGVAVRAQKRDPRVTRVGRLLRKARLDEMPQLLNVLRGDMSAVGPRPERPEIVAELNQMIPFHRVRHAVKPGMAGWAVVNYDYVSTIEDAKIRLQYDLYYIKHQSLWLDVVILLRTIGHVVTLRGR